MSVGNLLRAARIAHSGIAGVTDEEITGIKALADNLYFDSNLEDDIQTKILNDTELSDYASDKLYSIRREIRSLNERIRTRLSEYLTGEEGKYLQDGIITMRDNRYVLPVRAEYKRNIKGFIHDRSASGATFFIEPEQVLEMNNELRSLAIDEKEEVERILSELSRRVGFMGEQLLQDIEVLAEIDTYYARRSTPTSSPASSPRSTIRASCLSIGDVTADRQTKGRPGFSFARQRLSFFAHQRSEHGRQDGDAENGGTLLPDGDVRSVCPR